jgi:hypothetical protein
MRSPQTTGGKDEPNKRLFRKCVLCTKIGYIYHVSAKTQTTCMADDTIWTNIPPAEVSTQ